MKLQALQTMFNIFHLLGHGRRLQTSVWFFSPPQKSGPEISHSLARQCRPSPHVVVQGFQGDHNEKPKSTETEEEE
jgi:hypothetical protein